MDRIDEFLKSLLDKIKEERDLLREKKHVCPSEETAACYIDKLLKDTEKEDFEEHLAECGDCLQQIILLYDIKKEVEQSGYMEVPTEATEQAKNLVQGEVGALGSIIPEEPVPAGSLAPESSEKSLSRIISEFISNTIRARRGYRFVSYGSIALIVMLSVSVYSVMPPTMTIPPPIITRGGTPAQITDLTEQAVDYELTRGGTPAQNTDLTEQVIEEIERLRELERQSRAARKKEQAEKARKEEELAKLDTTIKEMKDLVKESKTAYMYAASQSKPTYRVVVPKELVEKSPVEPSNDNVTLEGKWEGTNEDTIEDEVSLGLSMHIISHGKDTDGSVSEVTIEEGSILRSKDKFKVQFETKEDAYVYIIIHDSLNKANLLFPDPRITLSNNVKANSSHTVPTSKHSFGLDENVGIETVYVLASETPLDNIKALLLAMEDVVEPKQQIMEFVKDKATELRAISFRHQ